MTDTNSFPSFFFANAKPGAPLSYEALVARRKIAESLMGKRSPFPKGLGEGLTYAGERIGDVIRMRDLDEQERALEAGRQQFQRDAALPGVFSQPGGAPAPEMPLPGVSVPGAPAPVAAAAAEPSLFQPAPVPPAAALGPNAGAPLTEFPALGDNFKPQTPLAGPMVPNAGRFMPNIVNANTGNSVIGGQLSPRSFGNRAYGALPDVPSAAVTPNTEPDLRGGLAQALVEQNQPLTRTAALPPTTATDAAPASPQIPPDALSPNPMGAPIRPPQLRPSPLPSPRLPQSEPTPDDNPPIVTAQIRPAPQVPSPTTARTDPYLNPPLDPLDPRPPQAPVPSVGRVVTPPTQFRGEPVPPNENDVPLNRDQIRGQLLMMSAGTDPFKQQAAQRLIEFGNQQRAAEISQRKQVYEARKDIYKGQEEKLLTHNLGAAEREVSLKKQEIENAEKLQNMADLAARGNVTPGEALSIVRESHKNAASIPEEVAAIRNAQKVLPQMVTGFGAEAKVNVLRVLSALGQPIDPSVSATQQFQSYVKGVYGRLRPQVIGAGPQANAEGKVLEKAAAGDISLTPEAINSVLNSIYSLNVMAAKQHQKTLITFTHTDPKSQQYNINTFGLPMENIVPDTAVRMLRDHYKENPQEAIIDFNRDFSTPGLAQKVLGLR